MNSIVFDCERMKFANTGIYHYCLNLAQRLPQTIDPLKERITLYSPPEIALSSNNLIKHHRWHKLLLPSLKHHTIWHSTYQHSDYIPSITRKIKVLLTIHDLNFIYDDLVPTQKKEKYLRNLQRRINRADAVVCISEYCKNDVLKHCSLHDKPVFVIHNGTNSLVDPALGKSSYKPLRPFLFSIGTLIRKKNFHSLIPLLKRNSYLDLIIAGRHDDRNYLFDLKQLAFAEGLENNFHVLGQINEREKSWYYHNCKAFVFPSVAEGFGLPLVEAMSVGKPVFLANKTALPEIGADAAFYFKDFSGERMHESFINGMNKYESDNMKGLIMKRSECFSWKKAADEYVNVYRTMSK